MNVGLRSVMALAKTTCLCSLITIASINASTLQSAAAGEKVTWVSSWAASPQGLWEGDFPLPTGIQFNLWNQTIRQIARVSVGGQKLRVALSNEYGKQPLHINAADVAISAGGSAIKSGSDRTLTFSGSKTIIIPPGASFLSDIVELPVAPLSSLAVSLFVNIPTPLSTFHWDGEQTAYIGQGNLVSSPAFEKATTSTARVFLSEIMFEAPAGARSVVALGDSITDGAASGVDRDVRWPDFLAERLVGENISVLNAGISGARLLQSKMGENALARFDRDVLSKPNIKTVIVLMGINDIAWPGQAFAPADDFLTPEALITGYRQLIARAHTHGVRIVAGTLTPFRDALKGSPLEGYYNDTRDALRMQVNDWIRKSGEFDAVVDLDKLLQDPNDSQRMAERYDSGDHLHAGADGNKAIAEAFAPGILFGTDQDQ